MRQYEFVTLSSKHIPHMDIIDDEDRKEKIDFKLFRPLALLIEWPLILLCLLGILLDNPEIKTVAFLSLAPIYLAASWYLFKPEKFKVFDIIVAIICGLGISVTLIGLLFHLQNWEYSDIMVTTGLLTLYLCIPLSLLLAIVRTFTTSDYRYELRGSWKLFSRLVFLLLMHYALGVGGLLIELMNSGSY